jgi:serine/threonine-protein kinase
MGEVYRAKDTRLGRDVAVKILPAHLSEKAEVRERFEREARAISSLNHPHICTLYDIGREGDADYFVMELLDGETLEARLERGAVPVDHAIAIALQVAAALAAAHRAGIVHRDLKPGNIFLLRSARSATPTAKLLDFGLAKTSAPVVSAGGLSMAPTTPPGPLTAAGTILGTFQYMAPEQIEGLEADARSDLFAFGCVLFEMLTGRKAFAGKTRASLLSAILKDEPPAVSQLQPIAPASLDRIVQTCLAKDPDDRWQTARDLLRELQWAAAGASSRTGAAQAGQQKDAGSSRRWTALVTGSLVSAALAGAATWTLSRRAPAPKPIVRLQATPPTSAPLFIDAIAPDVALSPDGTRLAYTAGIGQSQLWVRQLDRLDAIQLPGIASVRGPFFSPDGEWIAYFQGGDLKKVAFHGGPSVTICSKCADGNRGATWGTHDVIAFASLGGTGGIRQVPAAGGDSVSLTTPDRTAGELAHLWPQFMPGNDAILFTISVGGVEGTRIVWRNVKTGQQEILASGGSQPHYVTSGHVMYGVAGTLRAIGFDPARHVVTGSAVPVVERVLTKPSGAADFSVSRNGSLVYTSGDPQSTGQRMAWIDRQGHEEAIDAPPKGYLYLRLSPDGRKVALDVRDQQNDIWIWDFERRVLTRLTTDPSMDQSPVWTPDGRRIAFGSLRGGAMNLYWQLADGTGGAERLTTSPHVQAPWTFAPDGRTLVLRDTDPKTGPDVSIMSLDGDRAVKPLIRGTFSESNAEISPDGRWIAYQSDEAGRPEVSVRPFPHVDNGRWQISTDGGSRPLWARSGNELFFVDLRGRIMAVPVRAGGDFTSANPAVVAEGVSGANSLGRNYDVSLDGRRFLLLLNATGAGDKAQPPQLNIVLNWGEELERLVPAKK